MVKVQFMKRKFITPWVFLKIFILNLTFLQAQLPPAMYQQVGELEDYSFIQCNALYQDSRGLLWIGTYQGLDCWDGSRIISYPYSPFDSLGQPSRHILYITEDEQNNLWMWGPFRIRWP